MRELKSGPIVAMTTTERLKILASRKVAQDCETLPDYYSNRSCLKNVLDCSWKGQKWIPALGQLDQVLICPCVLEKVAKM